MKLAGTYKWNILWLLPLLAVLLVCLVCVSVAVAPAARADGQIEVSMSEVTVHRGQTFAVDVTVSNNTGLVSMLLSVDYDVNAFSLIRVERGAGLANMTMTTTNVGTSLGYNVHPFRVLFDSTSVCTDEGVVARFVFESNIDAPIRDYTISLSYDADNTNSAYQVPVALHTTDGLVHLQSGEFAARYVDWDGTELYYRDYNEGEVPAYQGEVPTRAEDDCYTYQFAGWQGDLSDDVDVLQYRAQYDRTPKIYSVFYYVDGWTDSPDSAFDVSDFYTAKEAPYGADVDLDIVPKRENYTFVGWFADEALTKPIVALAMPSKDTRVYGYMRYNVRTGDIPKIRLSYNELSETEVEVLVNVTYNPGLNGMVLTLSYDRDDMRFARFTRGVALGNMQFTTTNLEGGLDQQDFRFYWESAENATDTGCILSMVFDVTNSTNGVFPVTFTYDETHDATYINETHEIWYTRLDIVGTSVPVGERYHWNEPVGDVSIDVTSPDGKPLDVELIVKEADVKVADESMTRLQNQNFEIKNIYSINLMRNGEVVTSDSDLRIGIGLTAEELASNHLGLYYVDSNGRLVEYDFTVEDEAAVFNMRNIEYWVLVGDAPRATIDKSWTPETIRTVLLPSLLSLAAIAYALILLAQNNKYKREINNLNNKGGRQ